MQTAIPIVFQACDSLIERLEKNKEPIVTLETYATITEFTNTLCKEDNNTLFINSDYLALQLQIEHRSSEHYFSYQIPLTQLHIDKLSENELDELVSQWNARLQSISRPILRARYADLLWDAPFIQKSRNIQNAKIAIAAYLQTIEDKDITDNSKLISRHMARALQLAVSIKDDVLIKDCKTFILSNPSTVSNDVHKEALDMLWLYRKKACLSQDEGNKIIQHLEQLVVLKTSQRCTFDPYGLLWIQKFLSKAYETYSEQQRNSDLVKRIVTTFMDFPCSLERSYLPQAYELCIQHNLKPDADRLATKLRDINQQDLARINPIYFNPIKDTEAKQNMIRSVFNACQNHEKLINKFLQMFIPNKQQLLNDFLIFQQTAPMAALASFYVFEENRVAAIADNQDEKFIAFSTTYQLPIIMEGVAIAFDTLLAQHEIDESYFINYILSSGLLNKREAVLTLRGISYFYNKDYIAATSVLLSQFELITRKFCLKIGITPSKPNPHQSGTQAIKSLGTLLDDEQLNAHLGEDISFYFMLIFNSSFGLNLRNKSYHGLLYADEIFKEIAAAIIYAYLIVVRCSYELS